MRLRIVEDLNNGVLINDMFIQWLNAKTKEESDNALSTAYNTRFGSYDTMGILDIIGNFETVSSYHYRVFCQALKKEREKHLSNRQAGGK